MSFQCDLEFGHFYQILLNFVLVRRMIDSETLPKREVSYPNMINIIEKWVGYLHNIDREISCIAAKKLGETKDKVVIPE